jgi:hypothetical protein
MKLDRLLRSLLFFCLPGLAISSLSASTIDDAGDIDQKDVNAVREWINTKRQVTVRELGGALSISGEVRTEFQSTAEVLNGVKQRGHGGAVTGKDGQDLPKNTFDIEVNLMLDYRTDKSWGSIKLEFDNDAGIISGTTDKLKLERAYWGVRALEGDTYSFDIEAGRRRMSSIVDSKLEFNNFFDGLWFRYDQGYDPIGDLYLHAGVFIINENKNQFGYLGEFGILNIAGTGLYTKYSLIDWNTKDQHNKIKNLRYDFLVSQLLVGYKFLPSRLQKIVVIYLAGLINSNAHRIDLTHGRRANWGTYAGFSIGEIKKQGDWALDVNYQVLAAQCVPDFDVQGIGLGNANNSGFYTTNIRTGEGITTSKTAGGNVNYRGFQLTLDYLLTNQLNMQQSWQQSITLDNSIGPFHRYKQYEIEFIYGF